MKLIWQKEFCLYAQQFSKFFVRRSREEEGKYFCFFHFEDSKGSWTNFFSAVTAHENLYLGKNQ